MVPTSCYYHYHCHECERVWESAPRSSGRRGSRSSSRSRRSGRRRPFLCCVVTRPPPLDQSDTNDFCCHAVLLMDIVGAFLITCQPLTHSLPHSLPPQSGGQSAQRRVCRHTTHHAIQYSTLDRPSRQPANAPISSPMRCDARFHHDHPVTVIRHEISLLRGNG